MMNPRFLFIFVVALCCIFLTLGQDVAKSEGDDKFNIKDLKKKINFDNEMKCIENFFHCLTSSNRTIERFMKADEKCCAKTLNDSNDIWFVTFHFCVSWQTSRDVQYCMYKTGRRCRYHILHYFARTFPDYLQFEKDMMDRIDPRPQTAEECDDSFLQSYGKAFKEQCKVNTDKNLDPMCKASRVH
ncbi:uncharacterized protein LOC111623316 isoform X2 [Centruroides sculpturatus]|uniref:uncharacterized protein LOC111623316 isoform X2 n=1 Tax=Centruroides sculpturatus TaxID=218467 RepID=UPI000C6ECFD8|nr:uncharacterized protein LOC111623316 isoform X2 [Centruroides sculpturatus]